MKGFLIGVSIGLVGLLLCFELTSAETLKRNFPRMFKDPDAISQVTTSASYLFDAARVGQYEDVLNKNVITGKWGEAKKSLGFLTEESQGKSPYILVYKALIESKVKALERDEQQKRVLGLCQTLLNPPRSGTPDLSQLDVAFVQQYLKDNPRKFSSKERRLIQAGLAYINRPRLWTLVKEPSEDPTLKEGAIGCLTASLMSELVNHSIARDTRAIAEMIADEDCYMFKPGVEVYIREKTYGMLYVKIRGTDISLWFIKEFVML